MVVYVTLVVPTANADPLATLGTVDATPQLSVAVAEYVTAAVHIPLSVERAMFDGQATTGASASDTTTLKLHEAVNDTASVTEKLIPVVPFGNDDPLASPLVCESVSPGQLSLFVGVKLTGAVHTPAAVLAVNGPTGHVIRGLSASVTTTLNEQSAVLVELSVDRKDTAVVPLLKAVPLTPPTVCATVAAQLSVVDASENVVTAEHNPLSVVFAMFDGH